MATISKLITLEDVTVPANTIAIESTGDYGVTCTIGAVTNKI